MDGRHRRKTGIHDHKALVMHTYGEQGPLQFTVLETLRKQPSSLCGFQLDPRVTRSPALMGLAVLPFLSVSSLCPFEARCLYFRLALSSASSCFSFQSPEITGTRHHVPPLRSLCAFAVSSGMSFMRLHLSFSFLASLSHLQAKLTNQTSYIHFAFIKIPFKR